MSPDADMSMTEIIQFFRQPRIYHIVLEHFSGVSATHRSVAWDSMFGSQTLKMTWVSEAVVK